MNAYPLPSAAVGRLDRDQVVQVLRAAVAAPSLHNSQPWRFGTTASSFEVFADPERGPRICDPDHRAVYLACGAALFNLRLMVSSLGVHPDVRLFPDAADPSHVATVSCEQPAHVDPMTRRLAAAIALRHTYRRPMLDSPVPDPLRAAFRAAAHDEHAWLVEFPEEQLSQLRTLVGEAHRLQHADPAFVQEWRSWTARPAGSPDGVPATAAGPLPEQQDVWVLRDFSGGDGGVRAPGRDFESDPYLLCVATFVEGPHAQVQAGAALQRVLLRAAADGVTASFLSQLIEVPSTRRELRRLIGGALRPQVVLRLGYGGQTPATARRSVTDVIDFAGPTAE
ncbi:MAG: hypothetical protein WKF57_17020 [Nakamurella sp.]